MSKHVTTMEVKIKCNAKLQQQLASKTDTLIGTGGASCQDFTILYWQHLEVLGHHQRQGKNKMQCNFTATDRIEFIEDGYVNRDGARTVKTLRFYTGKT